jgi:uncharacterized protein (TIGR00730 family)
MLVNRDEFRSMRFALEYQKADLLLRDAGICSTIMVVGGGQVKSPEEADLLLSQAKTAEEKDFAERAKKLSAHYQMARDFGRIVSERGGAMDPVDSMLENVIATGGGPGIMEAANRGAFEAGAPTIGYNIKMPEERGPNCYSTPELTFSFHYFAMRKMHAAIRATGVAAFAGGFSVLDEVTEFLTLIQTRKAPPIPVVLVGREFWERALDLKYLVDVGMAKKEDLEIFEIVDSAEEAWESLVRRGLKLPIRT